MTALLTLSGDGSRARACRKESLGGKGRKLKEPAFKDTFAPAGKVGGNFGAPASIHFSRS